jgi:hypothetical protein
VLWAVNAVEKVQLLLKDEESEVVMRRRWVENAAVSLVQQLLNDEERSVVVNVVIAMQQQVENAAVKRVRRLQLNDEERGVVAILLWAENAAVRKGQLQLVESAVEER